MNEQNNGAKDKNIVPVVSNPGGVKVRKKSLGKKFAETFLVGDVRTVRTYVEKEVIIPAIKKTISDIIKNGVDMMFYGTTSKSDDKKFGNIDYVSFFGKTQSKRRASESPKQSRYDYDELIFENEEEARMVLSEMVDLTIDYKHASVADLFQLCGRQSRFVDNNYGWVSLSGVKVLPTRGGWYIDFPKPIIFED